MMEYSWYSVISPEACAAILWRDSARGPEAAEALKPTSGDFGPLGIIDGVIKEPPSGAQSDPKLAAEIVKKEIMAALEELKAKPIDQLLSERLKKYRNMGKFEE